MSATVSRRPVRISVAALALSVLAFCVLYRMGHAEEALPDFADIPAGDQRKEAFFDYFLPLVEQRNQQLLQARERLLAWRERASKLNRREQRQLQKLARRYDIEDFEPSNTEHWDALLRSVDIVPPSLALAQAANESAWGTSRFSNEGFNFYGQWCFVPGCGMIPANRAQGKSHEVTSFASPRESVEAYIYNLNRHPAYAELREIRAKLRAEGKPVTGAALAAGLTRYSERGDEYVSEMRALIASNGLDAHDR